MTTATDQLLQNDSVLAITAPSVRDHFGVWGIQPDYLQSTVDRLQNANFADHLRIQGEAPGRRRFGAPYATQDDDVAVIELRGPLTKRPTSFSDGTSTVEARRQISHAVENEAIKTILLIIESPGGTVAGTHALADAVASANRQKPVVAIVEDLCASAAYWVASQAGKIYANPTALIGNIGTYMVLRDVSQVASQISLKVHVVRAGKHKGAGVPGTEITAEQLAQFQEVIDAVNEQFLLGVAAGRKMSMNRLREIADGRVLVGQQAVTAGLINGIKSYDAVLRSLHSTASPSSQGRAMATSTPAPVAHTPSADPVQAFIAAVGQHTDSGLSQEAAVAAVAKTDQGLFAEYLSTAHPNLSAAEKLDALERGCIPVSVSPTKGSVMTPQHQTSQQAAPQGQTDPIAEFNSRVAAKTAAGMSRRDAIRSVVKADRRLHARYIAATSPNASAQTKLGVIEAAEEATGSAPAGAETIRVFNDLVAAKVQAGMPKARAVRAIAKAHPALHQAFLVATNPQNRDLVGKLLHS